MWACVASRLQDSGPRFAASCLCGCELQALCTVRGQHMDVQVGLNMSPLCLLTYAAGEAPLGAQLHLLPLLPHDAAASCSCCCCRHHQQFLQLRALYPTNEDSWGAD